MAPPVMETCFVSCCANRTPNVVSWGRGGQIAFGTCNSVALYDPEGLIVTRILNGHKGRVNAVQWVHRKDCGQETHLISGGSDNHVIVWEGKDGGNGDLVFSQSSLCVGHSAPVFAVDALHLDVEAFSQVLIASAASDSTVRVWRHHGERAECVQTLSFAGGFMMDVSLALLPSCGVPILACAGDDCHVYLFVQQDGQFEKTHSLLGHEDWVRGVEWAAAGASPDGALLLASCSQDCLIRVWRMVLKGKEDGEEDEENAIRMKETVFDVKQKGDCLLSYAVSLETVLAGHENWVYGLHWQPPVITGGSVQQPLSLLSASMDKTMILWGPEEASGVWLEKVRVGEVGGNTLGFYGCQMSPDGSAILAHAFHGALHLWRRDDGGEGEWRPAVVVSGHFGAVQDLSWDPDGEFVLSVSSDQTARLFTPWRRMGRTEVTWHEVSRPQIHGYDMQCLSPLGRFQFVSGADEKVLRVFRAPRNLVANLGSMWGVRPEELLNSTEVQKLPEGACSSALGLSNKAVYQGDMLQEQRERQELKNCTEQYGEPRFHLLSLTEPPPEDDLLQNTLWPEVQKLYGHGFEIFCLASDRAGTVLASACKASRADHANILLWSTSSWKQLQSLSFHTLTVTQMSFSPNGRLLLAVSRDRAWSLWRRRLETEPNFALCAQGGKGSSQHTRIIWSCDWSADGKYFVTSSRDRKVIVWGDCSSLPDAEDSTRIDIGPCSSVLDVGDSCTAVSFCPVPCPDLSYLLAVGLECGRVELYKWTPCEDSSTGTDWSRCGAADEYQSHALAVKRLRWRPRPGRAGHKDESEDACWVQLASAGADHMVKVFNVDRLAL